MNSIGVYWISYTALRRKGGEIKMPAISKIRFTNAVYDNGEKRYNDEIFEFDGHNGAIVLENGGGKTTFIQIAIQAILPHADLGTRKIRDTLLLEGNPCHIAIEWIINESPRRYALTAVTLFLNNGKLDSYKYVYEYGHNDGNSIENIPFVKETINGNKRPSSREEMGDYYHRMAREHMYAKVFSTSKEYHRYVEENYKIILKEWRRIALINGEEGGIRKFFEDCKTTENLVDRLLIPVVEEGMEGEGTKDFVNFFEEKRERFKKHKYLKKTIDESRKIQNRINEYVKIYGDYHAEEKKLNDKKSYGKALHQHISQGKDAILSKLEENLKEQEKYQYDRWELGRIEESYELALLKNKFLLAKEKHEEIIKDYQIHKEEVDIKKARIQNLKIARLNKQIQELREEIAFYEEQLESLERDKETSDLERELAINSSKIRGYFQRQIDSLNRKMEDLKEIKDRDEKKLKEYKAYKIELEKRNNEIFGTYHRLQQKKDMKEEKMENIKREILSNPESENIQEEYPKWTRRVGLIEEEILHYQNNKNNLLEEKNKLNLQLEGQRKELEELTSKKARVEEEIKKIEEEEGKLLIALKENISNLYHINSIYIKKEQILATLENKCESLRKEKEDLFIKERMSYRFLDDYRDNLYFSAEPLLYKWIKEWQDEFSFLELGSQFIERMAGEGREVEDYYRAYPYWALAVVVADKEDVKLRNKLEKNIDKISYPIVVLSQSEGQEILRNGSGNIEENILYPAMWQANIVRKSFQKKKGELEEEARKVTEDRRKKEDEISIYNNLLLRTEDFLNKYPYVEYLRPLKDKLKELEENIYDIRERIDKNDERIREIDEELISNGNKIEELSAEGNLLNKKIERAIDYIKEKYELATTKKKIHGIKIQLDKVEKEIYEISTRIERIQGKINQVIVDINNLKNQKNNLLQDSLYKEVRDFPFLKADKSIEILKIERNHIRDKLDKRQKSRRDIEENIRKTKKRIDEYEIDLKNERRAASFPIEEIEFPIYGDREIEELIDEVKRLIPLVEDISKRLDETRVRYNIDKNNYESKEKDFYKEYDSIVEFTEPLEDIKEAIEEKKKELDERYKYLKIREERLNKEYKSVSDALDLLERKHERYDYLSDGIEVGLLSEDLVVELPYNRMKYVNLLIEELEKMENRVKEKLDRVGKEKVEFERFCNNFILDARLRNMALSGIDYKDSFEDLTEWKLIMDKNIDNSIKILEQDLMEQDREINQFINQIHSYLKTIAEEIRSLSKKTRIKVGDKWKEIYVIDVPTWEEEVGKQKLIDYINYLLEEIEDIRFKDEEGNEDKVSVRKFIENRFQGKELLKIVMGSENIKVKCRKVTNDGRVNSIPISWTRSNNWSGGERWSKNMTLFLGILNYLAEKSQSIQSSRKRNRTVILDNPFGEASSDHVLDPVFFIAEKLGFQIIALTAHGEGKYIRDFFPVVYSCKLRPSKDNETQIFTKKKEINYAFFRDKDPAAIMRLGDVEQLSLI